MTEIKIHNSIKILLIIMILTSILVFLPTTNAQPGGQPSGMESVVKVINVTFSDDEPMEGDSIVILTYIKNNNPNPITNLTVSFLLNNEVLKNITGITLGANQTKLVEYEWTTEKGQQNIGVILYKDGNLIQSPMVTESIYVEQEPLGDIGTLVLAILAIFIFILILVILPSIWSAILPEIKPYEYLKRSQKP